MVVFLFPTKAEASTFLRKLSKISRATTRRVRGFVLHDFLWNGRRIRAIITGLGKNILRLAEARIVQEDDTVILTGLAKALRNTLKIGDILGVESVKKEKESGSFPVTNKPFQGVPYASLVTCDRFVFHCAEDADLADMEGFYARQQFKKIAIVKAVSDKAENIEFLNEIVVDGKILKRRFLRCLKGGRWIVLIRVMRNARWARKRLAGFLLDFLEKASPYSPEG